MTRQAAHPQKSILTEWLWLLVTAPGRMVILDSPYQPDEVIRRLKLSKNAVRLLAPNQISVRLAAKRNARRFVASIEPGSVGTRIVGQMQTPYLVAALRVSAGLFLLSMMIIWMQAGRVWLALMFGAVGIGFLFLSQYERLIGQDLRLHLDWLRSTLDAKLAEQHR